MRWRQVMFPDPASAVLAQHESALVLAPCRVLSIFEVNIWGMLFYAVKIQREEAQAAGIDLHEFVGYLLLFFRHAASLLLSLGYSGPMHVEIAINSLLRTQWLSPQAGGWHIPRPGSGLDDDVEFPITTTGDRFRDKPDDVVADILRYVFFAVNWPALVNSQGNVARLLAAGRGYNFW